MPIPSFTPGYPPDGSTLGQTKSTIRDNIDGTFQTLNVDHIDNNGDPGSQPPGYHTIIHEVPQTSVSTVNGYNQIFSGVPGTLVVNSVTTPAIPSNGDTQLYSLTGAGGLSQITGNSASSNGYCWMGGILLQWGTKTLSGATSELNSVSFTPNFPRNFFSLQVSLICKTGGTSSSNNTLAIVNGSTGKTGFQYQYNGNGGGSFPAFFWLAIGN